MLDKIPATTSICTLCIGIWLYIFGKGIKAETFAFNYVDIIRKEEWWRSLTGTISHIQILHIAFNMSSLWNCQFLERSLGTYFYLRVTFFLFILITFTMLFSFYIGTKYYQKDYSRSYHLGYSGILFGLMSFECWVGGGNMVIFGLSVPYFIGPILSMAIIQLLVPNASFIGHLSGIICGFTLALPITNYFILFDQITHYLFCLLFPIVTLTILYSVKPMKQKFYNFLSSITGRKMDENDSGSTNSTSTTKKQRIINGNLVYETV